MPMMVRTMVVQSAGRASLRASVVRGISVRVRVRVAVAVFFFLGDGDGRVLDTQTQTCRPVFDWQVLEP